ncbi:hypothetical protein WJX75_007140 [Coccomyxa subellipsoidea]|uniref:Uncharacterized protein n=1 Tax=Coccomyxa subellipsoidea TaxID=248742 RepID=A0ABR2YW23_9CHLO
MAPNNGGADISVLQKFIIDRLYAQETRRTFSSWVSLENPAWKLARPLIPLGHTGARRGRGESSKGYCGKGEQGPCT